MAVFALGDVRPQVDPEAWIAESAGVIGAVVLAKGSSVWPLTVVRGDNEPIRIGESTNVQDGAVLHSDPGSPLVLGAKVTVGHKAVLHGCTVGDGSLIGIGAVVLNGAVIGRDCLVGAGALVTEGKSFPDGSLIVGSPAKAVRVLTPEQIAGLQSSAQHYAQNAARFRTTLHRIDK